MQQQECAGRILVVDDERAVAEVLRRWLIHKGFWVRNASGFQEAVQALGEDRFELVTLDVAMPQVDGLEVLRWIRAHYPEVGVIMASGVEEMEVVIQAMRLGAIDYLIKPFNMELVTKEIERAIERQRLIAENREYQQQLERRVEERTRELESAYEQLSAANAQLEQQVRELQGRDRLVRFQMQIHTLKEASAEVLDMLVGVLDLRWAALLRQEVHGQPMILLAKRGTDLPPVVERTSVNELLVEGDQAGGALLRAQDSGQAVVEDATVALPVRYCCHAVALLWCSFAPSTTSDAEKLATLERLSDAAALVLRGAMLAEDLEAGALPVDGLQELGRPDCELEAAAAVARPGRRETGTR